MSDTDPQDVAESVDGDKLDDRDDYAGEGTTNYPPDRPLGVNENLVEPGAEENVAQWVRREEPDPLVAELDREADEAGAAERSPVEELLDELDVEVPDGELDDLLAQATAEDDLDPLGEEGRVAGPLIDPTPGFDDEPTAIASEGDDLGDESAEEAAVHIEVDPG